MESSRMNLGPLLDRIRKEGVEEARAEAGTLLAEARKQADSIREEAENQAAALARETRETLDREKQAAETALAHAARDLLLSARRRLENLVGDILRQNLRESLSPQAVAGLLSTLAQNWSPEKSGLALEALVPEKDLEEISRLLEGSLAQALRQGVDLLPAPGAAAGLWVGERDGALRYDFTDQGLAEALSRFLSPRVARLLREAAGEKPKA